LKFQHLDYVVSNKVAEVTMRRPPVNALNFELVKEINAAYRTARDDAGVRAIILTSAYDNAFSAGMDLSMMLGATGLDERRYLESLYFEMHDLQYRLGKPTIAAVGAPARAAGVTIAVACNVIIASEKASFAYPEINVGVMPAMHFVHLPRHIGRHKAFELLFTGNAISATEAERLGIINRVVKHEELMPAARDLAAQFAAKSPVVMQLARDCYMRVNDYDYRRGIEDTADTVSLIMSTEDAQEGMRAFAEKRKPKW
jgi:enoyl-CoA hydratase/carnithine racemase